MSAMEARRTGIVRPRVVVVGGGFGGVACVRNLRRSDVDVTLIDRRNHTLFQPLLYQVATGVLDDSSIASPIRRVFGRQRNVTVVKAEVEDFDMENRVVKAGELEIPWDHLVIAAGVQTNYFGNDWESLAPGLKTLEDAHVVRARVLDAFEQAEVARVQGEHESIPSWLTFVVVGAGATGVEVSGAIKQLAVDRLAREFHDLEVSRARVVLVEGGDRILAAMSERSSASARKTLERYGVEIRTGTRVVDVTKDGVRLAVGDDEEFIDAQTVIWGAGVKGSPLAGKLANALGLEPTRGDTIPVAGDLTVGGRPDIRVIGDLAHYEQPNGEPVPGVAQGAIQMGIHAGKAIARVVAGKPADSRPFHYRDKGSLATIGRGQAVLDMGRWHLSGFLGWVIWAIVHIAFLVNFRSRISAMGSWIWAYVVQDGVNELITTQELERETSLEPKSMVGEPRGS